MKDCVNGIVVELTPEEEAQALAESAKRASLEKQRPLTEAEVSHMLLVAQANTIPVDDATAIRMKSFYPEWAPATSYAVDFKVQYNGHLFKVIQAHTSQNGWEPTNVASLWTEVCESHSGTLDDAIPYNGNMALEQGKYYTQYGGFYLCFRETGNPVYQPLKELVGLYVKEV